MADPVVSYEFDPTGQASSNRITGEQIIIQPPGDRLFHYTMPEFAPFFEVGLVLKLRKLNNDVIPLVKGVDYYLGHKFMDASLATMHPIFGSIQFLKRDIVGTIIIDYNTLGGVWTIASSKIEEILANTVRNPRITTWESVVDRPIDFPVIDHEYNLDDMVGQKELLEVFENFYLAYLASMDPEGGGGGGASIIVEHINSRANPHQVTAAQTGAYSMLQVDTKLAGYVAKTEQASDSQKLAGKTLAQVLQDVVATKVNSATSADTALNATNAATAANSTRLATRSLAEVLQDAAAQTSANSTKFNNKTYSEVTAEILSGKAADSDKLAGKTLAQIVADLQQATGDAATLGGKTLAQLMGDVKATKVDNATHADSADNSTQLGGQSLSQVLAAVGAVVPDNAHNAEKVYGYTFEQLIENFLQNSAYIDGLYYYACEYVVEGRVPDSLNNGGTQDPLYTYTLLGQFSIPLTGSSNDKYDPSARRWSSSMEVFLFYAGKTIRLRVTVTIKDDQSMTLEYFSDHPLNNSVQLGVRNVNSNITSIDGSLTAKFNQVFMKFLKTDTLRKYAVFQFSQGDFELDEMDNPHFWDHTYVTLNTVVWQNLNTPAQITALQANFDALAEDIEELLDDPAA